MASAYHTKPPVILIVEDEVMLRMELGDMLTDAGYRVIAEATADHALAVIDARPDIKLLFTDVVMPGPLDGCALARIVDKRWPQIGLLVASGKMRPSPGELPDRAHFVAKPYRRSALLSKVKALLYPDPPLLPQQTVTAFAGAPVIPSGIFVRPAHTDIGHSGAIAEPTTEFQG